MQRHPALLLICAAACDGGCVGDGVRGGDVVDAELCTSCRAPRAEGKLAPSALVEASGVAASRTHADTFYLHNDAGDEARLFVIDGRGADRGVLTVDGASFVDWEDVAVGPCEPGASSSCIFIADIGDNDRERAAYDIYRVPEPASATAGSVTAERFTFTYPDDAAHDAETLLVTPSGALVVVTKVKSGASAVFAFPSPLSSGATLLRVGEVTPPTGDRSITGGDVHPEGKGLLLRSRSHLFFYPLEPDALDGEAVGKALGVKGCSMPVADEDQGEAVGWLADGSGYLTVSEGSNSPVSVVRCE